jgi:hypothetical protein
METGIDLQKYPEISDKIRILLCKDDDVSFSLVVWHGESLPKHVDGNIEQIIEVDLESSVNSKVLEAAKLLSSVEVGDCIHNILTTIVNGVWRRAEEVMKVK